MTNDLFSAAKEHIPGGVNSPVRAFKAVSGTPVFIKKATGATVIDTDDKRYIDYVGSWGAMILGHAHPEVVRAVHDTVVNGLSFGAPTELETAMANKLCALVPSMKKVRMVNSGTEAAMSAIRLARGFTRRDKIVKFEGCYHGHADSLLVKAGSGALTLGVPTSPGVPADFAQLTITLEYNNADQVKQFFAKQGEEIAAIIVEPIAGNMNCILGKADFLQTLRAVCDQYQTVLIFDEVMTGFRVALGGAQSVYQITPDLTILGKVIGGGLPVGAFGGRADIMDQIAPDGPVYQAGTLSGNPVAMAAGLKTLELISSARFFDHLNEQTGRLMAGLTKVFNEAGIAFTSNHIGGMFGLFFSKSETVDCLQKVMDCNQAQFKIFFHELLKQGIYLAPSAFEAGFVSSAHRDTDIEETIASVARIAPLLVVDRL